MHHGCQKKKKLNVVWNTNNYENKKFEAWLFYVWELEIPFDTFMGSQ